MEAPVVISLVVIFDKDQVVWNIVETNVYHILY